MVGGFYCGWQHHLIQLSCTFSMQIIYFAVMGVWGGVLWLAASCHPVELHLLHADYVLCSHDAADAAGSSGPLLYR